MSSNGHTNGARIGILTSGGDCPGLNAAIRGVAKAAIGQYGMNVVGISNGFRGLIHGNAHTLQRHDFDGILTRGGTILGTSREKPFTPDQVPQQNDAPDSSLGRHKPQAIIDNYHRLGLDCLVVLGGNGTHKTALLLAESGLNVVGLPKTIDNDIFGTDITFGFHSAVDIATDAIDRLHSTAHAHDRVMVIETMGHKAGWLGLYAGVAGGGDVILLPEIPYSMDVIVEHLRSRAAKGKQFSIVVVAEGAISQEDAALSKDELKKKRKKRKDPAVGYTIARQIEKQSGMEARVTVLGYQQRGGTPSAYDRLLATQFGTTAADLIHEGRFNRMVALENGRITSRPFSEVAGKLKTVDPQDPVVLSARAVGACFGDE